MKKSLKSRTKKISVFGINAIESLINFRPEIINELYFSESAKNNSRIAKLKLSLDELKISYSEVPQDIVTSMSSSSKHQGVFAFVKLPKLKNLKDLMIDLPRLADSDEVILILDSIKDPNNFGACLRTAYAAGVNSIIIPQDNSSPVNEYVFKSSVGAFFNVVIYQVPGLAKAINLLKDNKYWITGLDSSGVSSIYESDFSLPSAIIIGSEGEGMRRLTKSLCDYISFIPMKNHLNSLNASVACGIVLFELNRQRNK